LIGGLDHVYHIADLAPANGAKTSKVKKHPKLTKKGDKKWIKEQSLP